MDQAQIPMGLGMALAQRPEAMEKFSKLNERQRQEIVNATHSVHSKKEMQQLVDSLMKYY